MDKICNKYILSNKIIKNHLQAFLIVLYFLWDELQETKNFEWKKSFINPKNTLNLNGNPITISSLLSLLKNTN